MQEEIWKDIPTYEGIYQVSNLGNVKSLSRVIITGNGDRVSKEKMIKQHFNKFGYLRVTLTKDGIRKEFKTHQLVAMAFLNHIVCGHNLVVDHINENKSDNKLENLQIVSNRFNVGKSQKFKSSMYIGVSWNKKAKKWISYIKIKNKLNHLGYFTNELEASRAYNQALINLL
jgi:hypothetical protein